MIGRRTESGAARSLLLFSLGLLLEGLLVASARAQAVSVPVSVSGQSLTSVGESFELKLDTLALPVRPEIRARVTTDPGLVVDLELLDCDQDEFYFNLDESCFFPNCVCEDFFDWVAGPASGSVEVLADLWRCLPVPTNGSSRPDECTVRVTAVAGTPASFDLDVTAAERVTPGGLNVSVPTTLPPPITVDLEASRDATIYQATSDSNGAGQTLQAGGYSPNILTGATDRRALLAFDLEDGQGSPIPYGADILSAAITLHVIQSSNAGTLTELHRVDPTRDWGEGTTDPPGDERTGLPADPDDATWFDYRSPLDWTSPGGDFVSPPSATLDIFFDTGPQVWQSAQLAADVQDMVNTLAGDPSRNQGWILRGPPGSPGSINFQIDSRESAVAANRPMLSVTYQENAVGQETLSIDKLEFIPDADNLRWIYDDDPADAEAVTATFLPGSEPPVLQGRCELLDLSDPTSPPFLYTFLGSSGFVGHDCCVWTADSEQPGSGQEILSQGCGQAVIHLGLPTSVPIPDFDGDGIGDPCDNCFWFPNGPEGGTCTPPTFESDGTLACQSDLDCPVDWNCSKSQEDEDKNRVGNACPEPGLGVGLAIGLVGLVGLGGGRRRRGRG